MANYSYNGGVPAANNDPGVDQPDMLINTQSIRDIWTEDHIGFNANDSGTHLQTTFVDFSSPAVPTSTASVAFPAAGVADATVAQYYFQNADTTLLTSSIKAFATFTATTVAGAVVLPNSYNVTSVVSSLAGLQYTINLSTGCTTGSTYLFFASLNDQNTYTYSITGPVVTFNINAGSVSTPARICFVVIQA